jgi:hypothetical protein
MLLVWLCLLWSIAATNVIYVWIHSRVKRVLRIALVNILWNKHRLFLIKGDVLSTLRIKRHASSWGCYLWLEIGRSLILKMLLRIEIVVMLHHGWLPTIFLVSLGHELLLCRVILIQTNLLFKFLCHLLNIIIWKFPFLLIDLRLILPCKGATLSHTIWHGYGTQWKLLLCRLQALQCIATLLFVFVI